MPSEKTALYVTMLGNLTLQEKPMPSQQAQNGSVAAAYAAAAESEPLTGPVVADLSGRSHRLWMLIAYLIANRQRGVSAQELIDLLWPDVEGNNPTATLQNNVSRARTMLKSAGFKDSRNLVKFEGGLYRWAPDHVTIVDAEEFEIHARRFSSGVTPEEVDEGLAVCYLYNGDFMEQASSESWVVNLSIYYRTLFTSVCHNVVRALLQLGRLEDVQRLCLRAVDVDPAVEEFSLLLMRSLIHSGNPRKALEHYDYIKKVYQETYGVAVSPQMDMERELALQAIYGRGASEKAIVDFLQDKSQEDGAFFCSNNVFREIVHLRMREMRRSGQPAVLMTVSSNLPDSGYGQHSVNSKRMEQILTRALRAGDPFTKMGPQQFLVLLPGANEENAPTISERITAAYKKNFPQAEAEFDISFFDLASLGIEVD